MATLSGLDPKQFEATVAGKQTALFVLTNTNGAEVCVTNYGAIVVSIMMPDRNGAMGDVVLGLANIDDMLQGIEPYFGAVIGRYGNRIANGKITLDGETYHLPQNQFPNCLHGGSGFNTKVWDAEQTDKQTLVLRYLSVDGEDGFPGNLQIEMTYTLTDNNEFRIDYKATTDKLTVCNLTNHSFFNLAGIQKVTPTVCSHLLTMNCDEYIPVDDMSIPLGGRASVEGTPFDFRTPHTIGERIDSEHIQTQRGRGYDHSFCVKHEQPGDLALVAVYEDPESGRVMKTYTTEPGCQVYTANWVNNSVGVGGCMFPMRSAICFEAQHHPDSPNRPDFEQPTLAPGETYKQTTVYAFSVKA